MSFIDVIKNLFTEVKSSFEPPPPKVVKSYGVTNEYATYIRSQFTSIKNGTYFTHGEVEKWEDIIKGTYVSHGYAEYEKKGIIFANFTDGTSEKIANYELKDGKLVYYFSTAWRPPGVVFRSV
ncbi:hypothetical protein ACC684_11680 [Rhizobium ruizarguesonis]